MNDDMMSLPETRETAQNKLLEAGRWLFAQGTEFRLGVVDLSGLPPADRLELAFAGRSNVGKSSLINALTNTKALARISSTPGRTQELNFFALAPNRSEDTNGAVWLVDMPGYGYARESKSKITAWNKLLFSYLRGRASLRRVFVLVDARHGLKANDLEMLDKLDETAVSYQIVMTKADKPKKVDLAKNIEAAHKALAKRPAAFPELIVTSSEKGDGIAYLRATIAGLVDLQSLGYKA